MPEPVLFVFWPEPPPRFALAPSGLVRAFAHRRAALEADHPFAQDGPGPALTLELAFADDDAFRLAVPTLDLPSGCESQAMRGRRFATPAPAAAPVRCTLLVAYHGRCADPRAWLDHYDAHHPPIMLRFPAIRDVVTYRPAPDLPIPRAASPVCALQRNKVVFDSPAALLAALASPVMAEMRRDRDAFPPFAGFSTHFPALTREGLAPLTPFEASL